MKKKVLIIGAGTIGLHSAYYLHQRGFEVEILDSLSEDDEKGCSYGNCGMLVPSHFIPLASPAMLHSGFKMMFDRKSPVYLPVMRNIGHFSWFLKFMQAANKMQVEKTVPLLYRLNDDSRRLYEQLNFVSGNAIHYGHRGMLMASTTEKGFDEETKVAAWGNKLGIETVILDKKALKELEPDVEFNVYGSILYKSDGHVDPLAHQRWLKKYLKVVEVVFQYNTEVTGFGFSKGNITEVKTQTGTFKADEYVLATGAFSQKLAAKAGVKLPILPGKGYSIDFPKSESKLQTPLILTEAKVAVTPFNDRIRLGSGMEFNGQVGEVRLQRVQTMLDRTKAALPDINPGNANEQIVWEGLRPVTSSGVPYIGRTKKYTNLLVAAGHAMMGVSLAPVTGKIISQLVAGEPSGYNDNLLMGY